jgi:hypothetical protein
MSATWSVRDLQPSSPWLDGCPGQTSVTGVAEAISLVITHLLAMVEAEGPIEPKAACLVLQHLTMEGFGRHWGGAVVRLASRLKIDLPKNPNDWHNGVSLQQRPLPRGSGG